MTDHDITGPTVLLTGPTSGIGAGMLSELVRHPSRPRLLLLARDAAALDRALGSARAAGLEAHGVAIDLGDLASVRSALERVRDLLGSGPAARGIDVALLNAGAQFVDRSRAGAQGWELTFTVNVIAQHLLVRGLEPMLAPAGHVVLMGSSTHRGARASFGLVPDPRWQEPGELAAPVPVGDASAGTGRRAPNPGGVAYATSKLALVTLSHGWAERLGASGRRLNTYDPGLVAGTGLGKDMPAYKYWVWKNLMPAMRMLPGATSVPVTARHAVALGLGDEHPELHGGYVEIGRRTEPEAVTRDAARQAALVRWLDAATEPYLPGSPVTTSDAGETGPREIRSR